MWRQDTKKAIFLFFPIRSKLGNMQPQIRQVVPGYFLIWPFWKK